MAAWWVLVPVMETLIPHSLASGAAIAAVSAAFPSLIAFSWIQRRRCARANTRVAEAEERLAVISTMQGFGFWSWDAATDRIWASAHVRRVMGMEEGVALSRDTLLAAVHPADRSRVLQAIAAARRSDGSMAMELRVVGHDGEVRWISTKANVFRDGRGAIRRMSGCVMDDCNHNRAAAELKKLQQKLTHLTRVALLGELSGALAHELQQPLTAILCNAQAAQLMTAREPLDVAELREILQEIVSDDQRAGQVIQSLRALLLRGETKFQRVDIGKVVGDVMTLARGALMERNVQVNLRIDGDVPPVNGDPIELQQVLLNLVLNACESLSDNPARDRRVEVVAGLDDESGAVRISVLDCGIDTDQLERVFDPFFTTKESGLGLGLAICHSISVAHGGRLWATNRADRGAAFHFTLPVATREDSNERHHAHSVHSG
jgi:C4-dicarboxylate-specific signal transduction histidine kinase